MTPPDDVSTRLAEIRERVEAATEGPAVERMIEAVFRHGYGRGGAHEDRGEWRPEDEAVEYVEKAPYPVEELCRYARSDVPWLLSLVEGVCELLDGWERAYPTDIFPEPPERPDRARLVWVDPDTGEKLSETFALGRVSAAMGRFMAAALRRALRDAAQEKNNE